jgi:GAF domain-containing protein
MAPTGGFERGADPADSPDQKTVEALLGLADTLVGGCGLADMLQMLADRGNELVDADGVGVVLTFPEGQPRMVASSSERMRILELFEIESGEGPCLEAIQTGQAVINGSLAGGSRWPQYAAQAQAAGYQVVHALPMRHHQQVLGVVNILDHNPVVLDDRNIRILEALADLGTFAILQSRARQKATDLAAQLQTALRSRIIIEQAKGVLSERLGLNVADAFLVLRDYCRNTNQSLTEVAGRVVERALPAEQIVAGAPATRTRRSPPPPRKSM